MKVGECLFFFFFFWHRKHHQKHVVCLRVGLHLLTLLPAHGQRQLQLQLLLAARLRPGLLQV